MFAKVKTFFQQNKKTLLIGSAGIVIGILLITVFKGAKKPCNCTDTDSEKED